MLDDATEENKAKKRGKEYWEKRLLSQMGGGFKKGLPKQVTFEPKLEDMNE